jgi:hypothetical protein
MLNRSMQPREAAGLCSASKRHKAHDHSKSRDKRTSPVISRHWGLK